MITTKVIIKLIVRIIIQFLADSLYKSTKIIINLFANLLTNYNINNAHLMIILINLFFFENDWLSHFFILEDKAARVSEREIYEKFLYCSSY